MSQQKPQHLLSDKYKTFDELNSAMHKVGIESIQVVLSLDFSDSNDDHDLHSTEHQNPYQKIMESLWPVIKDFDDDGEINAYRFSCRESKNKCVVPLFGEQEIYKGINELMDAYNKAAKKIIRQGPTTFAPTIQKCIELEQKMGGEQLIVCILITDGEVSDPALDKKWIEEATRYPIVFVGIGVGPGPFGTLEECDDELHGKFDNFQFVNFNEIEQVCKEKEKLPLVLATAVFNELPEQYEKIKQLGYI